jgi:hypothetical protein
MDPLTAAPTTEALTQKSESASILPVPTAQIEPSDNATGTKMAVATKIFTAMKNTPGVTRKQVIEKFMAEAKLSRAGASTYYQLIHAKLK